MRVRERPSGNTLPRRLLHLLIAQLLQHLDTAIWNRFAVTDTDDFDVAKVRQLADRAYVLLHVECQADPPGFNSRPGNDHIAHEQRLLLWPIERQAARRVARSGENSQRTDRG